MMARSFPRSLGFFVVTGVVFLLQWIPPTGFFLMLMQALFWSILLVNAGMIGVAFEASSGRVARWWLALPIAFYGGYWAFAAVDHIRLYRLSVAAEAGNASVVSVFDPSRQALVFDEGRSAAWLTQNSALPVAYTVAAAHPVGYLAHRMVEKAVCDRIGARPAFKAASVYAADFHDGDGIDHWVYEKRFCELVVPERPNLPQVHVSTREVPSDVSGLPATRRTTTIVEPDGRRLELVGGTASPLSWLPRPVVGCFLNSMAGGWVCMAEFERDRFTPVVSGTTRFHRHDEVLARALGLTPVAVADRRGADPTSLLEKAEAAEAAVLARQLADVEARIADPAARVVGWEVGVLERHPEVVASKAAAIMTGLERASASDDLPRANQSGQIFARLLATLSRARLAEIGPRLVAVYAHAPPDHWLWEVRALRERLGELGPDAAPYLVVPLLSPGRGLRR